MLKIECSKCKSKYNINEDQIGKKAKCKCGEIIEIVSISNIKKKFNYKKIFKIAIIAFLLLGIIIYFISTKKEFIVQGDGNLYYVLKGEKFSNSEIDIYDKNKKILYENVNTLFLRKISGNYIVCNNEILFRNGKQIDRQTGVPFDKRKDDGRKLGEPIFDKMETDCKVYNYEHELLGSKRIITGEIYTEDIYDYLKFFDEKKKQIIINEEIKESDLVNEQYEIEKRDNKRNNIFNNINSALMIYITKKGFYPLPDDYKLIKENDKTIYYKGKIGENVLNDIGFSNEKDEYKKDPLTGEYFDYYVNLSKKTYYVNICYEGKENINNIEKEYYIGKNESGLVKFDLGSDCK